MDLKLGTRACARCGAEFALLATSSSRHRFCSKKCRTRTNQENFRKLHPERDRAYARAHYARHRDEILAKSFRYRTQAAARKRLARTGMTADQFTATLDAQQRCCAICKVKFPEPPAERGERWAFALRPMADHDHVTGLVRGVLCHSCNSGLGHFRDNPELLQLAIDYLISYGKERAA